jgi:hypothetical protein
LGKCKDIEPFWAHFFWRRRLRRRLAPPEERYLGNCREALARCGTFVECCAPCHASHNWRDVTVPEGWYQTCCHVESACQRVLRKK